jgi:glycosyltransferase involved in cell wall biosynthesis
MASGVPVVASWSGGIPDQLAEGGGLLVPRNDVTALADAIALLATNTRLRHELAAQALKSFHKNFTWETAHANYRRILQQRPQLVTAAEGLGRDHA